MIRVHVHPQQKLPLQASPPISSHKVLVQVASAGGCAEVNDMTPTHNSSSSEDLTGYGGCGGVGVPWRLWKKQQSYIKQQRRHYLK
jgi:hypothetical protein